MASPADEAPSRPGGPGTFGVEQILARAADAGLPLTGDEARGLLPAVGRLRAMADEVRALAGPEVEPSGPAVLPWRARVR